MTLVSKIMLGFVFIAALVFMWFAARTLTVHEAWRETYNKGHARELALEKELDEIREGKSNRADPTAPLEDKGNRLLRAILDDLTITRGRVWRNVRLSGGDLEKGIIVGVEEPTPHGIEKADVVWVFTARPAVEDQPGMFLGEFTVTDVPAGGKQVTLMPIFKATASRAADAERLAAKLNAIGDDTLTIYERRPQDLHEYFAPLSDEDLTKMIPPESLEEYLRDGTDAKEDDPAERKVAIGERTVFRRRLRDYATLFIGYDVERTRLIDEISGYQADIPALEKVVEQLKQENEERAEEIKTLMAGNAQLKVELTDVEGHEQTVQQELDEVNRRINEALEANKQLSEKLKQLYSKAQGASGGPAPAAPGGDAPAGEERTTAVVPESPAIIR